jgi:hypothetical protein
MPSAEQNIGPPILREHALGCDDEALPVRAHHREKGLRRRRHVAVHEHLAGAVENAHLHRLDVVIDPAIAPMLAVVESHLSSPPGRMRAYPCAEPTHNERCAAGGLNKNQADTGDDGRTMFSAPTVIAAPRA